MSKVIKRTKLGLVTTAAGVIVALAAMLVLTGTALATAGPTGASAAISSPTAAADGSATATLTMTAPSGSGVGNWAFDVGYIAADYGGTAPTCTASQGSCTVNPAGAPGIVRFAGFASGLTGTTTVGQIAFKTSLTNGACSNLTLAIAAKAGSTFQDALGADFTSPTFTAGRVCAEAVVTNSPTPGPGTATATPVVTPKVIVNTGGPPGDSSGISLAWLLGAAGLMVVAGGAWTLARARREEN